MVHEEEMEDGQKREEGGALGDLYVNHCSNSHLYLLESFGFATIFGCTDCTIVVGAVKGRRYGSLAIFHVLNLTAHYRPAVCGLTQGL